MILGEEDDEEYDEDGAYDDEELDVSPEELLALMQQTTRRLKKEIATSQDKDERMRLVQQALQVTRQMADVRSLIAQQRAQAEVV